MDIERINENTVKFYISYIDIEERGFSRDEIWFNREKSEELFWEMMDEIDDESDFEIEGPLWIQVHAMDSGLEVTVTRAYSAKDGQKFEPPFDMDEARRMFQSDDESFNGVHMDDFTKFEGPDEDQKEFTFVLNEFDDLIPLSERMVEIPDLETFLYFFNERYYLHVKVGTGDYSAEELQDILSLLSEFVTKTNVTIYRLDEYGKQIIEQDVFEHILKYFG